MITSTLDSPIFFPPGHPPSSHFHVFFSFLIPLNPSSATYLSIDSLLVTAPEKIKPNHHHFVDLVVFVFHVPLFLAIVLLWFVLSCDDLYALKCLLQSCTSGHRFLSYSSAAEGFFFLLSIVAGSFAGYGAGSWQLSFRTENTSFQAFLAFAFHLNYLLLF